MRALTFGALLQAFFLEHLRQHRGASPHTVDAYRDTFRLLLSFVHQSRGTEPSKLRIEDLDGPVILDFLDHLERVRGVSVRTRNARLAAIRSFFRYVTLKEPESLNIATRVLAIPVKRAPRRIVGYLTRVEVIAVNS